MNHNATYRDTATTIPFYRTLILPVLLTSAVAFAGCGQETGIVVNIAQGTLEESPDTLRFLVGVEAEALNFGVSGCGTDALLQRFVEVEPAAGDVVDVSARNLTSAPYRLLLRPGDRLSIDQRVLVAVIALRAGEIIGVGSLDIPVGFIDGRLLEWDVALRPRSSNLPIDPATGCLCTSDGAGRGTVIVGHDDNDCDGDLADTDCDDDNPHVGPSQLEQCGNGIDDNCDLTIDEPLEELCDGIDNNCDGRCDEGIDGDDDPFTACGSTVDACDGLVSPGFVDCDPDDDATYPGAPEACDGADNNCIPGDRFSSSELCYVQDVNGDCRVGRRSCDDFGVGWLGPCTPLGTTAPYLASPLSCPDFAECPDIEGRFDCANNKQYEDIECVVAVVDGGGSTTVCPGAVAPLPDAGAGMGACTWTLLGDGLDTPYDASLWLENGDVGPVVSGCNAGLSIQGVSGPATTSELLMWLDVAGQPTSHIRVTVSAEVVPESETCPPPGAALVCSQLSP